MRLFSISFIFISTLLVGGCAEKAKTIQIAAESFRVETTATTALVETLRTKELADTPMTDQQKRDVFVGLVLNTQPNSNIDQKMLSTAMDPFAFSLDASSEAWIPITSRLRNNAKEFAAIFTNLDKGSFVAVKQPKAAIPVLNKLIHDLVAIATAIKKNPPEFIRRRAAVAVRLEDARDNQKLTKPEREAEARAAYEQLLAVRTEEDALGTQIVAQATKAAVSGNSLRELLGQYDQLTLADISEGIQHALDRAGDISGSDMSAIKAKSDAVLADIVSDPVLKNGIDSALNQINAARAK